MQDATDHVSDQSVEIDAHWLDRFASLLSDYERIRIPNEYLWRSFERAFPHRQGIPQKREWFLKAMSHAEMCGVIRIPPKTGKRWDRTLVPFVPKSADRIQASPPPKEASWRKRYWHNKLAWVYDLSRLTLEQEQFLLKVQQGFKDQAFDNPAPLKRRSLELTGDEKKLSQFERNWGQSLFASGRLSLDMLGCIRDIFPLTYEILGLCPRAIVFENAEPYAVAISTLKAMERKPYGLVAYGDGKRFQQSVRSLKEISLSLQRIDYVGDLDCAGLSIAQQASKVSAAHGLPSISPAPGMHHAMLVASARIGFQYGLPCQTKQNYQEAETLTAWLPNDARSRVLKILKNKHRVPEEVLSSSDMLAVWATMQ